MYYDSYDKELMKKGYSEAQIQEMHAALNNQIEEDRDCWGPCCRRCEHRGQATKGCGLWCLRDKPRPEKQSSNEA